MKNTQPTTGKIAKKESGTKRILKAFAVICIIAIAVIPHPHRQLAGFMDTTEYRGYEISESDSLRRPAHTIIVYTTSAIKAGIQHLISNL